MSDIPTSPFIFVGENLALDLVNTEMVVRRKRQDTLQTESDVQLWWETVQSHYSELDRVDGHSHLDYDAVLLDLVKKLRGNLRHLFEDISKQQAPHPAAIAYLNQILQRGHPMLVWEHNQPHLSHDYGDDPYAPLLLPIALAALHLITHADLERLHRCHNNQCILLFYDTTKSGTRRWCTTACMDRERSARRYKEAKDED